MLHGHGDDLYAFGSDIEFNFSSNVISGFSHDGLRCHLASCWHLLAHYPEPDAATAEAEVANWLHVRPDEVLLTRGATDAIYLVAQMARGRKAIILEPTFAEYRDACRLHGVQAKSCFGGVESIENLESIENPSLPDLVWLCNPNNPTGDVIPKAALTNLVDNHPATLFAIDQSYGAFTLEPLFTPQEAASRPNLLLIHSMTKLFAVPGLRLGYVTACPSLVARLRAERQPWAVGTLAAEAARYLVRHADEYGFDLPLLLKERARVSEALTRLGGIETSPSQTHFLLCRLRTGNAAALKEHLALHHRLLIRDASNFHGLTPGHFRIAVQGRKADDRLIRAIGEWLWE